MITTRKYILTVILLAALSAGTFFYGLKLGNKGYALDKNYRIINQNTSPKNVDYGLLWQAMEVLNTKFIDKPIDQQKLLYGAVSGMVDAVGDHYTAFFNPKEYSEFKTELAGSFEGIGAEVGIRDSKIQIISPLDGSPAKEAGLLPGDVILKIDDTETLNLNLEQAVRRIRGQKGTKVRLSIFRIPVNKQMDFTITRQKIEINSLKYSTKEINGKRIEIIDIQRFGDDTLGLFRQAVLDASTKNVSGLVIDLRDDPGGYLETAVAIASYWVDKDKPVVAETRSDGSVKTYKSKGDNILKSIPTVVLINGGSASASEILAGALRDYGHGKLVGVKSFGKGSVQELVPLKEGAAIKITVAKWMTPKGININQNGLEPDIKIDRTPEQIQNNEDPQMDKALELLR